MGWDQISDPGPGQDQDVGLTFMGWGEVSVGAGWDILVPQTVYWQWQ